MAGFGGINLAPLGKKLSDIEGAVGQFFGGLVHPAQTPQAPQMPVNRQAAANIGTSAGLGPLPPVALKPPAPTVLPGFMAAPGTVPPVKPPVSLAQRQTAAQVGQQFNIGPNQAPLPQLPAVKQANPVLGTAESIGSSLLNRALANPNLPHVDQYIDENGHITDRKAYDQEMNKIGAIGAGSAQGLDKGIADETIPIIKAGINKLKAALTPQEKAIGDALGMTPKETAALKANPTATRIQEPASAAAPPMKPTPEADLQAKIQGEINRQGSIKANPKTIELPPVAEGDHAQAIANSQQLSRPIDTARTLWESSMRNLQKVSPEEFKNFWKAVENPSDITHSPALQQAIATWRQGADLAHAGATALNKGVGYIKDYARHPWDLSGWAEAEKGTGGGVLTTKSRTHQTITEGEAAGLKLGTDPLAEGQSYFRAASSQLRKDALIKGLSEADAGAKTQPHTLDLGYGKTVQLSDAGIKAAKGTAFKSPSINPIIKGIRTAQGTAKAALLDYSQFHTINIGLLRAAPALVAKGHPVAAAKGVYGLLRGAFGQQYADRAIGKALTDGTIEKAAQIGMPYGSSNYTGGLKLIGVAEHTVFGKQIPMMHDQVARSIISDLEKRGVPLNSPQARAAGKAGNNMMGFINDEAQRVSPGVRRAMSDWLLAGQFTPSKFGSLRDAARGGVAGQYARATVTGNVAALTALAAGIGFIGSQNSDDLRDLLLRSLVDPAAPTSGQDQKGNTIKLRLPGSNVSDVAKLLGMKLVRGQDGHLGVDWHPSNIPTTVEDYLRSRLSPIASSGVKILTNTTFAGKPLYDPNASLGTKIAQGATSLAVGTLPIGTQGLAYTDAVKNHVPGDVKSVLDAQTPGTNPVLKSIGSAFGITPSTDTTVGKGQQSAQYFDALATAKKGLTRQEQDAIDLYSGSKKNPLTGKYDIQPTVDDQRAKATTLLQSPKTISNLIAMNQTLANDGQKVDPLWSASKDQITKYLQYQAMPPDGPDQKNWRINNPWYQPLQKQRSTFFDSLPPGDPNKPKAPIEYPQASPQVAQLTSQFFALPDGKTKAAFIQAHPQLQDQFNKQTDYYNNLREAQGYAKDKTYPTVTPQIQANLNAKNYKDPATQNYLNEVAQYNVIQGASQAQFQGTQLSQQALKGIYDLGNYDITKTAGPNGATYALGSSGGGSGKSYTKLKKIKSYARSSKGAKIGKVSLKSKGSGGTTRLAVADKERSSRPKVSLSKSLA